MLSDLFLQNTHQSIGLNTPTLIPLFHMMIRSIIIYFLGIVITRFNKKLIGIQTPFNFILFVMLGSIFAGAIIDADLFLPLIGSILFLTFLNVLVAMLSFYFPSVEQFIKGAPSVLVKNGTIQWHAMRKNFITRRELYNELYAQLHVDTLDNIELAILESNGAINFIKKK